MSVKQPTNFTIPKKMYVPQLWGSILTHKELHLTFTGVNNQCSRVAKVRRNKCFPIFAVECWHNYFISYSIAKVQVSCHPVDCQSIRVCVTCFEVDNCLQQRCDTHQVTFPFINMEYVQCLDKGWEIDKRNSDKNNFLKLSLDSNKMKNLASI